MTLNIILPQTNGDVKKKIVLLVFTSMKKMMKSLKEKVIFKNVFNSEFHTEHMISMSYD
jgi:hypothetical protein